MKFSLPLGLNSNHFTECLINSFQAVVPNLHLLKTPENLWFSGIFKKWKHLPEMG